MNTRTLPSLDRTHYSFNWLKDEARQLVESGVISRQQPIYILCDYIPAREWFCVESELERFEYLLRDRIGDLLGSENWTSD